MQKSIQICTQYKRAAAAFIALAVLSSPVAAQSVCADRVDVVEALKGRPNEEKKQLTWMTREKTLHEFWGREGGGWSHVVHLPSGQTCILSTGDAWVKPIKESH